MNLRQIEYFVAIYEEGSFSKAAVREHCTQPGMSAQIRNLEEEFGSQLFERSVAGVTPTQAGQGFYRRAVSILKDVESAGQELLALSGEVTGTVRIGLIPSIVRGLLPNFFPGFVAEYPEIRFSLMEGYSGTLTDWVMDRTLDLAVVTTPPSHEGLNAEIILRENVVLISGPAMGLTAWAPVTLAELPPLNLVVTSVQHSLGRNIESFIRAGEIPVNAIMEMDSMTAAFDLARETEWCTLLPFTSVLQDIDAGALRFSPVAAPDIKSDFYLIHQVQRPLNGAAQVFADRLRAEMTAVTGRWRETTGQ